MKYFTVSSDGETSKLTAEPTPGEVYDGEGECTFLSAEIVRGDEVQVRKAVYIEPETEDGDSELDWELVA